MYICDTYVMF